MLYEFSTKELEVLKLALLPIKEIAKRLNLSEGTVKSRLTSAINKTNGKSRFQALQLIQEHGILSIDEVVTE